jgi:hypothetical protein
MKASSASCKPSILILLLMAMTSSMIHVTASARDAMAVIDHCRSFLQCLQHQVEWTTERATRRR